MTPAMKACAAALAVLAYLAMAQSVGARPSDRDVAQTCHDIVGLPPGEKHFAACTQSLTDSLRNLAQDREVAGARRECLAGGLQPDTGTLAECELTAQPTEIQPVAAPVGATPIPGGARDYFTISRETAFQRIRLACARLAFDPDQGAFGGCVADLKAALARASEPSM